MSSSTDQTNHQRKPAPAGPAAPGNDDMLGVLQDFQQQLENLRILHQDRTAKAALLGEREAELVRESQRLAGMESELKKGRAELAAIRESAEQSKRAAEEAQREVERSRAELDTLAGKLASRETELNKASESLEKIKESFGNREKELRDAAAELAGRETAVAERTAEQERLATRNAELERQVAEAKAGLATQQAKAAEAEVALRREFEAAMKSRGESAKAGGGNSKAEEALKADLEAARNRIAAQQSAIEEHARALGAEKAQTQRLSKELAAAQAAAQAAQASAQAAPAKAGTESERAKLEKAAKALIELRTERDELTAQTQRLKKDLEAARKAGAASAKATGHNDAIVELRRSRLKRYRALVREQSQKVMKANETLKARFEHAEKLNAQRDQLAEANEKIKIAQRKLETQRSKARAAALVFYAVGSAMVLAVMSWVTSGWAAPGTYVASAVVSAQGRGRTLNAAELGEWQAFHQQMVNDPRFHEVVAERMSRRGITTLATPGAVRELVTTEINTRSVEDGELVIELRGTEGPERTARVLETLTTALASHANSARQQRVDGAVTAIKQTAQAGAQPIDNTRFIWAAGMWVASVVLTGIAGWLLWKRMNTAKVSFEKTSNVDELLDEAKWVPPAVATQMRRDRQMLP